MEAKKRIVSLIVSCLFLLLPIFLYAKWFLFSQIIGGDWPYYFPENLWEVGFRPLLWMSRSANGLGGVNPLLGLYEFHALLVVPFFQWMHIPWEVIYKVGWFGLMLLLGSLSMRYISQLAGGDSRIAILVFITNTYQLLLAAGGQMGVALGYSITPLVVGMCVSLARKLDAVFNLARLSGEPMRDVFRQSIYVGVVLAVQMFFDPRITYISLLACMSFFVFHTVYRRQSGKELLLRVFVHGVIPGFLVLGVHLFWIIPMIVLRSNPIESMGAAYSSVESVRFFSFADFSHALSLLHPNWPENIFGKTYFLQPEFLIIPLMAFAGLLLVTRKIQNDPVSVGRKEKAKDTAVFMQPYTNTTILFFGLLSLLGVFLSKGANPPFGGMYIWLFEHVPGFIVFRDPTKFYVLIALSYAVLLSVVMQTLQRAFPKLGTLVLIVFLCFWGFTIREAVLGRLGGTFVEHSMPGEYDLYKSLMQGDPTFVRSLWVPRQSRFVYTDLSHLSIEAEPLLGATTSSELASILASQGTQEKLHKLSIGYVVIPYDALGEIFVTDRLYDHQKREEIVALLDAVPWLTKLLDGNLTVYKTSGHADLFTLSDTPVTSKRIHQSKYDLQFQTAGIDVLTFSTAYHAGWVYREGEKEYLSKKTPDGLNSFTIETAGVHMGVVEFAPQRIADIASILSLLVVCGIIVYLVVSIRGFSLSRS